MIKIIWLWFFEVLLKPFGNYTGIALFGIGIYKYEPTPKLENHELIHWEQQKELWFVGFLIAYLAYYLLGRIDGKNHRQAYLDIPFEREAYANDKYLNYLENRPKQAWINYIPDEYK